jgi:lathosterol oxidase
MFRQLLGLDDTPLLQLVGLVGGGLLFYFLVSGLSYGLFFVWGRDRFHPNYVPDPAANREAMKWGAIGVLGNAVLMLPFQILMAAGYSQVYYDVSDHGWAWFAASSLLYVAFTETCIYWVHRSLHTVPFLYRHLHAIHHKWKASTSWVSMAFHPLDSFAQALPHHLAPFLFPVHGLFYTGMVGLVSVWSVLIHDRVSVVKWKLVNYTDHHTVHHWVGDYNYGQFTTIWDRIMGSYRDPDALAANDPGLRDAMSHHDRPAAA